MINKCKVEMRRGELYNVVEPLKEGEEEKTVFGTEEIESHVRDPFLCFYFSATILSMYQTE